MKIFQFCIVGFMAFLLSKNTYAQSPEWFPIGAKWYYDQYDNFVKTYSTLEVIKDTLVDGKDTRAMIYKELDYITRDTLFTRDTFYLYEDAQRIFYTRSSMDSVQWCLLYDFSLKKGDTFRNECADITIHIDSVYQTEINGHTLKTYAYFAPHMVNDFTGTVYEYLGHQNFFFAASNDRNVSGLRCCDGPVIGHYNSGIEEQCDTSYISVGIEKHAAQRLKIWPNPTANVIYVELSKNLNQGFDINIADITGRNVRSLSGSGSSKARIDVGQLPEGVYLLSVVDAQGKLLGTARIVKQQP